MNRATAGASGMSLHCRWGSELTWEWLEGGVGSAPKLYQLPGTGTDAL